MTSVRTVSLLALATASTGCAGDRADEKPGVPDIVEVFACSDYCPGPEEQYIKRVYEGVTGEDECRELGGRLFTYVGWGERTVCEVE